MYPGSLLTNNKAMEENKDDRVDFRDGKRVLKIQEDEDVDVLRSPGCSHCCLDSFVPQT